MSNSKTVVYLEVMRELGVTFFRIDCERFAYPRDFKTEEKAMSYISELIFDFDLARL